MGVYSTAKSVNRNIDNHRGVIWQWQSIKNGCHTWWQVEIWSYLLSMITTSFTFQALLIHPSELSDWNATSTWPRWPALLWTGSQATIITQTYWSLWRYGFEVNPAEELEEECQLAVCRIHRIHAHIYKWSFCFLLQSRITCQRKHSLHENPKSYNENITPKRRSQSLDSAVSSGVYCFIQPCLLIRLVL